MGIHFFPVSPRQQLDVLEKLLELKFVSFDDKLQLDKIINKVTFIEPLSSSEINFVNNLLRQYGHLIK